MSYRALNREFALDDDFLEDLKAEIIKAKKLARDEDEEVLVWTGAGSEGQARPLGMVRLPLREVIVVLLRFLAIPTPLS